MTRSSAVFKTGLISNIVASLPTYALYKALTNLVISLNAFPLSPRLNAMRRAWNPCRPNVGSMDSLKINSGVSSATASMSMPPWGEYMMMLRPFARSSNTLM